MLCSAALVRKQPSELGTANIATAIPVVAIVQPANFYPRYFITLGPSYLMLLACSLKILLRDHTDPRGWGGSSGIWSILAAGLIWLGVLLTAAAVGLMALGFVDV